MSSIYDWSLLAPENAYADESINWSEGQRPSSVNDSARVMMQRIKEYLLDHGGVIDTEFINEDLRERTTIHLNTKSSIESYVDGIIVRFKATDENRAKTFISLNSLPAQAVYKMTLQGIAPLKGKEIQTGGIYELIYSSDIAGLNNSGWFLTNPTHSFQTFPPGFIATFAMEKMPTGWLLCDGSNYLRDEYPELFAAIGETWGSGDSYGTFNVPDLRGVFLRGLDNRRGLDYGRSLGSFQKDSFKAHSHRGWTDEVGRHSHNIPGLKKGILHEAPNPNYLICYLTDKEDTTSFAGQHKHRFLTDETGDNETRPVNMAVVYAIKT
ncbi:tail fiber protein [Bartonella doshiae]|uniref:Phage Tail Collar Domain n=2 Tax=Bartonella doshiae TaxID=33044 RepID=A0A380ZKE6_BARDO|nr:tail fiber protein [Bartonella doshiae]EJF79949.1 hypothetical protein MCS_01290 [Bartonella doshiae NCTC 12862 = ATCC 700133]MBB6158955.1 microcystin-dependent protein [Bartonella doshiae]SUV45506.1 Phage Tail Collar Domain [Bartonella doshiae]